MVRVEKAKEQKINEKSFGKAGKKELWDRDNWVKDQNVNEK